MNESDKAQEALQENSTQVFSAEDIEKNRTIAGLAYILFFLPLLAALTPNLENFTPTRGCCYSLPHSGTHHFEPHSLCRVDIPAVFFDSLLVVAVIALIMP